NNDGTPTDQDIAALRDPASRHFQLIQGHTNFGIHQYLSQPCTYITFLRHPVSRVVSHYHYVQRQPDNYLYERVKGLSLKDYITSGVTEVVWNWQVRQLNTP